MFISEDTGNVESKGLIVGGYSVGDRILEGVDFEVRVKTNREGEPFILISVAQAASVYFSQLNTDYWLREAGKYLVDGWADNSFTGIENSSEDFVPAVDLVGEHEGWEPTMEDIVFDVSNLSNQNINKNYSPWG